MKNHGVDSKVSNRTRALFLEQERNLNNSSGFHERNVKNVRDGSKFDYNLDQ